jgi:hypothetical protein
MRRGNRAGSTVLLGAILSKRLPDPSRTFLIATLLCFSGGWSQSRGGDASRPDPLSLRVFPAQVLLRGPDAVQQLVVEGLPAGLPAFDLTSEARFAITNPSVASVDEAGTIAARGDGSTTVTIRRGGLEAKVAVRVKDFAAGLPVNFANRVIPIFTKLGCNAGGCHGRLSGQNGFRLSLLGFEPALDYETLVKEGRGRRLFPAAPDASLLLQKAVARLPHGGGKRLDPASSEYRLIRRWIAAGMPMGRPLDPTVVRIEIYPAGRVLRRGTREQLAVTAFYSDGSSEDVTRWVQYQSNDVEVASALPGGKVESQRSAGQAAIMARYQGQVAVFRATVPLGQAQAGGEFASRNNPIDVAAARHWNALGITPSKDCTDAEFLRRASLDITGTLPAGEATRTFAADPDPAKRAHLVDRLVNSPEYASYFAIKWSDVLRNKREGNVLYQSSTYNFHDWIRENLARNTRYDQFVREIVAASGTPATTPAVQWYRRLKEPSACVDDTAQVFLGMRLQCARCHHHPFERWSQDDYYGFAAFFARVGRKKSLLSQKAGREDEVIFAAREGQVTQPRTGQTMVPKGLGGSVIAVAANEDPRQKLVDWMADPANPFFAGALVNRYWAHFFGRGIVEPMDDMRLTNPPSNPELLGALAGQFARSGYNLKALVRTICTSRVYGLSSLPSATNSNDKQSFARHYPRRMSAEVLLDAISLLCAAPTPFDGLPAGTRAIELPDESVGSGFLDTFGRPKRDTPCECERVTDASLSQSLMLLNSAEVQGRLGAAGGRAELLVKDQRPDKAKIGDLFWTALGRAPSPTESTAACEHVARHPSKKAAYEDVIWALINTKEFQFID